MYGVLGTVAIKHLVKLSVEHEILAIYIEEKNLSCYFESYAYFNLYKCLDKFSRRQVDDIFLSFLSIDMTEQIV